MYLLQFHGHMGLTGYPWMMFKRGLKYEDKRKKYSGEI